MADEDGEPSQESAAYNARSQNHSTGIVTLPRGSRGPRSLYLRRHGDSFGFTLRHFIVYPPPEAEQDDRHAAVGAILEPMDTIFVKHVKDRSAAKQAGLQRGDRLIAVNNVPVKDKSYSQVVKLIVSSPDYLHLLVVPKEEDVLQRFFAETAYNPASNQPVYPDPAPIDRHSAQQFLSQRIQQFQVDAISWRTLQQPYYSYPNEYGHLNRGQRSADSLLQERPRQQEIYAEIHPHESVTHRQRHRAQPQVPLYRKMGRRASEGCTLSGTEQPYVDYANLNTNLNNDNDDSYKMKTMYNTELGLNYPNTAGCRLSLDVSRRESTSSLSSSIADGSKDSLGSFDSTSTLTGHETDDSAIMSRVLRSVQQKEEFLRMPTTTIAEVHREFYVRPKKLDKPMWPPQDSPAARMDPLTRTDLPAQRTDSPSRTNKPNHQNFMRVKNDIESERDLHVQNGVSANSGVVNSRDFHEVNGASLREDGVYSDDDRRSYPQVVHRRTKEFESGKPLPEDDPMSNRIDFTKNELARISAKKLVPNVTERAIEYETRTIEPRRVDSGTSTNSGGSQAVRRIQRDSRSLDSSGSNASSEDLLGKLLPANSSAKSSKLSGNVTISTGSKYIHCPPPQHHQDQKGNFTDISNYEAYKQRARSNSAESWVAALEHHKQPRHEMSANRMSRQDALLAAREAMYEELPALIPVPVERFQIAPSVSVTPAPTSLKPTRPNQLNLEGPVRPVRHLKPPSNTIEMTLRRSTTPVNMDDKPIVVKRRPKNTNIDEEERVTRRESYMKATEGGRVHFDNSDNSEGDVSPQVLRSGSASSSSGSLDREKIAFGPLEKDINIIKEGGVHCKILEIDGKRATDRSWKQVWAVLKGPKLFLYKDRHHQSPIGNSDVVDHSLSTGVDMRTSVVRVAEEYTKRKNVLRVSSVKPCRSEFLLQTEEFGDWVTVLQEQVAASTEAETKLDPLNSKQLAVPQTTPATTIIQIQGSHLYPQNNKSKSSSSNSRSRSPTGQSPVSKSRKPTQLNDGLTSPKSKTWRGRVAKQLRKIQGASSPSSPTAPEGSTFGIPLEHCIPSLRNPYVPRFVEVCTDIVDEKGLQTIGIYRVPGNNASITALTEEINRNYDDVPLEDPKWNDLHVVSSLLKSYFRKMPDSLITVNLYPSFIKADKLEEPRMRMEGLRHLVKSLPLHNYHTLKHVIEHLNRVVSHSEVNRMEAKNLAIVFGPTIVRPEGENMESLVSDMTNQCKIVETLLTCAEWFFSDEVDKHMVPLAVPDDDCGEFGNNQVLLDNIGKYEALKDQKDKNVALFASIISAAQRKVRKATKNPSTSKDNEATTPTSPKTFSPQHYSDLDLKQGTTVVDGKIHHNIPTTVIDIEKTSKPAEKNPWFNYSTDQAEFHRRIENFKQETVANLQRPRKTEISINNIDGQLSSSASNVNQNARLSPKSTDMLTKTRSASNVFARSANVAENSRNSLDTNVFSNVKFINTSNKSSKKEAANLRLYGIGPGAKDAEKKGRYVRRVGSAENVNSGVDVNANGNLKKVKYENENEQMSGSLDSLNKLQPPNEDESDMVADMSKIFDQKLKEKHSQGNLLSGEDLPFADESPEKQPKDLNKENIPRASDLYKNPSLHKYKTTKTNRETNIDKEKDEDTTKNVPDNERHLSATTHNKINSGPRLRRSESLNKPERTVSPLNVKLKRSESLNKPLKRSDSLTKNEKTESNNNKKLEKTGRRKEYVKQKRKNGMPDRSIKRRHTVGGTKDPDKVTWLDNKYQEEMTSTKENKEKNLRTSSPDLSGTRRERWHFEISLVGPENMVVALRQHLMGGRPQSFPESTVFKVPLESHV